jgi:YihY family inner membrane protein
VAAPGVGRPGLIARLDRFQQERSWAGFPLAVLYKYADDKANYLAALVTYYAFVSLFPLLLLLTTTLGYFLDGDPTLRQEILDSALGQFPIIGDQLRDNVDPLEGRALAVAIGVAGALYGGMGAAQAAQHAMNTIWSVPRNRRPDPFRSRLRSAAMLGALGLGLLLTTALTGATTGAGQLDLPISGSALVLTTAGAVLGNIVIFLVAFRLLSARHLSVTDVLPGVLVAAFGWQALQTGGTYYVSHVLKDAGQTYGVFGLVLGLLTWIWLGATLVVIAAEVNSVRVGQLWPRSLLSPFVDDVVLTHADQRAYTAYAKAERFKSAQRIRVEFEESEPESDGRVVVRDVPQLPPDHDDEQR